MRRSVWKSFFTFVLVLVLTVGTVATLSMATAAKAETAPARYSQQVREFQPATATELSATIPEESISPLASIGVFALVLSVTGVSCVLYLRARRKERGAKAQPARRYVPRADMTFSEVASTRRV